MIKCYNKDAVIIIGFKWEVGEAMRDRLRFMLNFNRNEKAWHTAGERQVKQTLEGKSESIQEWLSYYHNSQPCASSSCKIIYV